MEHAGFTTTIREPWNKGKLVGQRAPSKLTEIWAIRVRLQLANRRRELALPLWCCHPDAGVVHPPDRGKRHELREISANTS